MGKDTAKEATQQTVVYLGNRNAIQILENPDDPSHHQRWPVDGPIKNLTAVTLAPGLSMLQAALQITDPGRGIWQAHSDDPAPAWVASTDPGLARVLSDHWGGIEIREPDHELAAAALGSTPAGEQKGK